MEPYVVRQGDYLTAIAHARGADPDQIWNAPENAKLREQRKNPEILAPLDIVYLPPVDPKWHTLKVGETNEFESTPPQVEVHVILKNHDGKPFASKKVHVSSDAGEDDVVTEGDGLLKLKVAIAAGTIQATVVEASITFEIRVGHLDPHDVDTGTHSRLRQLGYVGDESRLLASLPPYLEGFATAQATSPAVATFQQANNVDVTGEIDDAFCAKVREAYGC